MTRPRSEVTERLAHLIATTPPLSAPPPQQPDAIPAAVVDLVYLSKDDQERLQRLLT